MRTIKSILLLLIMLCYSFLGIAQTNNFEKSIKWKTNIKMSFYHMPSYNSERPFFMLEQQIEYRFHENWAFGGGIGINSYPFYLAMPIFIDGKYCFKIKNVNSYYYQSLGAHIKVASVFFKSNRVVGSWGVDLKLSKKLRLCPEIGYNLLFDRYGSGALSYFIGMGLKFT